MGSGIFARTRRISPGSRRRHRSLIGLAVLGVAAIWLPSTAAAATINLGQIAPPGSFDPGGGDSVTFQYQTGPTSPSYSVPAGGWTITSWNVRGGTMLSTARLQVWRPTPGMNQHTLVAQSELATLPAGTTGPFTTSIPVQENDVLGLRVGTGNIDDIVVPAADGDILRNVFPAGSDPATGQTIGGSGSDYSYNELGGRVNIAATLEGPGPPDTDPPETEIDKAPKNRIEKPKAKYKFSSDEAGSSFECAFDKQVKKGQFEDCDSPEKYKRLDDGKHKFQVRAIDPAGNVDSTPAKDKFKRVG